MFSSFTTSHQSAVPRTEDGKAPMGKDTVDEGSFSPTELLEKFKTLIREADEGAAKRNKQTRASSKHNQGHDKGKLVSKHTQTRLAEFNERTTVLERENDKLSEQIDKELETSNGQKDLGRRNEERKRNSLEAENEKLRQLCKEISGVNKKWQDYNQEVQLYIRQLEEALQAMNLGKDSDFLEKPQTSSQERSRISGTEETDAPLLKRYNDLLEEACQLQKELENCNRTEELLRKELEELRLESSETIKLLTCQLSLYKEDYEAERQEKQAAERISFKLSKELSRVRAQLEECQRRLTEVQEVSRSLNVKASPGLMFGVREREGHSSRRNDRLTTDSAAEAPDPSKSSVDEADEETVSVYECPECGKTFPNDRKAEYLEHFEECQQTEDS